MWHALPAAEPSLRRPVFFRGTLLGNPGWPRTHYGAYNDVEFLIILPPPPNAGITVFLVGEPSLEVSLLFKNFADLMGKSAIEMNVLVKKLSSAVFRVDGDFM